MGARVDRPLTVVLNEEARRFFPESEIPAGASIRWVSARMSPSRGTTGNMRRWLFANHLARQHRDALVFGLSQLEAPITGGRGIVTVHDMIPWLFRSAHPRQYHFYRHYLGRAVRRAHAVVTPSRATKDDVCRYYGIESARVHVIRHGSPVPLSRRAKPDKHRDRYILWIGRADPTKNLPALLAAFRAIEREMDVRLVIAGEGSQVDLGAIGAGLRIARPSHCPRTGQRSRENRAARSSFGARVSLAVRRLRVRAAGGNGAGLPVVAARTGSAAGGLRRRCRLRGPAATATDRRCAAPCAQASRSGP